MDIKIKKLTDTAVLPARGSEYAAGYDLYADCKESITIEPHETARNGLFSGRFTMILEGFA